MDVLYFSLGFLLASISGYTWYLVGRKTKYQDQNVIPPPNPIALPVKEVSKDVPKPYGYVDELTDPPMTMYDGNSQL